MTMWLNGHSITVRDLIGHLANVGGAVHAGEPRTDKQRALTEVAQQIKIGGYDPDIRALQAVARVVLRGLRELRQQVAKA